MDASCGIARYHTRPYPLCGLSGKSEGGGNSSATNITVERNGPLQCPIPFPPALHPLMPTTLHKLIGVGKSEAVVFNSTLKLISRSPPRPRCLADAPLRDLRGCAPFFHGDREPGFKLPETVLNREIASVRSGLLAPPSSCTSSNGSSQT